MTSWYESRIDRAIREAQERGDFDDLPGTGQPLPDRGELHDEDWWLKQLLAGPSVVLARLDPDDVVRAWRTRGRAG